jgi:hypothetical protein
MAGTTTAAPVAGTTNATGAAAAARPSDDEILGLVAPRMGRRIESVSDATGFGEDPLDENAGSVDPAARVPDGRAGGERDEEANGDIVAANSELQKIADANPRVREVMQEAAAYKEVFQTPGEARQARDLVTDVNRLDALFFSRRPEDHKELAKAVAALDRDAFAMLADSMAELAATGQTNTGQDGSRANTRAERASSVNTEASTAKATAGAMNGAQREFMQTTNAAAVESVVNEIEAQVSKLLPEGVAKPARNRVVGEIYRELDTALRGNRALTAQIHDAFRSGRLDPDHQRGLVSLITARAKQALPAVAKRVMGEWTSTVVTMNQERRARQRNAEGRVDIAGSGGGANSGRRPVSSKDVDYGRMSDTDILNL